MKGSRRDHQQRGNKQTKKTLPIHRIEEENLWSKKNRWMCDLLVIEIIKNKKYILFYTWFHFPTAYVLEYCV